LVEDPTIDDEGEVEERVLLVLSTSIALSINSVEESEVVGKEPH